MKIEYVPIKDLQFADYNPRAATKKEAQELKKSLERFGFVEPVVVNSDPKRKNIIIGGHFRVRTAKDLGLKEVPVHFIKISDEKKERELNLRLNKNLGHWNAELLVEFDENLLLDVGVEADELDKLWMIPIRIKMIKFLNLRKIPKHKSAIFGNLADTASCVAMLPIPNISKRSWKIKTPMWCLPIRLTM